MRQLNKLAFVALGLIALGLVYRLRVPASVAPTDDDEDTFVARPKPVNVRAKAGEVGLTLKGTVVNAQGQPFAHARVELGAADDQHPLNRHCPICELALMDCRGHDQAAEVAGELKAAALPNAAALTTQTDDQGRFLFEHLSGVSFRVVASAEGHGRSAEPRAVPGEPLLLRLGVPRTVAGRLVDEAKKGVAGKVYAASRSTGFVVAAAASDNGTFTFSELGEGPFYLLGQSAGKLPSVQRQVNVTDGSVELTMVTSRRLTVTLTNQGKPVDGAVRLYDGGHFERVVQTERGVATLKGLPAFEGQLSASSQGLAAAARTVQLNANETAVTLELERGGLVNVTLIDGAGQPIQSAEVVIEDARQKMVHHKKLKKGELAQLGPVADGEYRIVASADGFVSQIVPVTVDGAPVNVEVVLEPSVRLAGKVLDEYGRGAPGVSVLLRPTDEVALSDEAGAFHFDVPSSGQYELSAHHSDYGGVELKTLAPRADVELRLERKAEIEVKVTANGQPLDGAHALLIYGDGNYRSDRPSGSDGVVVLRGLPEGPYELSVAHPQYLPSVPEKVVMKDGSPLKREVVLKPGMVIQGTVKDEAGKTTEGVSLYFSPRVAKPAVSDATGQFVVKPVDPNEEYVVRVSGAFELLEPHSFEPSKLDNGKLKVVVKGLAKFKGRVVSKGKPVTQFTVNGVHEVTASDGRFEVGIAPQDEQVNVEIVAPKYEAEVFTVPAKADLGDFELRPLGSIRGRVRNKNGAPIADAEVSCLVCPTSVRSGADGAFAIAKSNGSTDFELVARKSKQSGRARAGEDPNAEVVIVLAEGVKVFGTVFGAGSKPVPGAMVHMTELPAYSNDPMAAVADAEGRYEVVLPPGRYEFREARELEPRVSSQVLIDGQQRQVDIGPAPGGNSLEVFADETDLTRLRLVRGTGGALAETQEVWAQELNRFDGDRVLFENIPNGRYRLLAGYLDPAVGETFKEWTVSIPTDKAIRINIGLSSTSRQRRNPAEANENVQ